MTSRSLASLIAGVDEVRALRTHYFVPRGSIPSGIEADAAKAHGRACVVLLSSHWERYFYAVNEEAIEWLNAQASELSRLPVELLLMHSRAAVDEMAQVDWLRRADRLREFVETDGDLWIPGGTSGSLDHARLLVWMKSPKPTEVVRFYRQFGVANIFSGVTRLPATRSALFLNLRELVEKRNAIAHGDATAEALPSDVTRYINAVQKFANSADSYFARVLRKLAASAHSPW